MIQYNRSKDLLRSFKILTFVVSLDRQIDEYRYDQMIKLENK